ncbi:MAG: 6-phosphogluconolactonase, partial [Candidatus Micrarchaeota archaeon]
LGTAIHENIQLTQNTQLQHRGQEFWQKKPLPETNEFIAETEALRETKSDLFMGRIVSYMRWLFGGHPYVERNPILVISEKFNAVVRNVRDRLQFVSFQRKTEDLPAAACYLFEKNASEAIAKRGIFTVSLCGGRAPKALFELLKDASVDWSKVHIFWGDERPRRPDVGQTNYETAYETFLQHIQIPPQNIHSVNLDATDQEAEANRYASEIESMLGPSLRFDLMLLVAGADGHTMSLFPGSEVFEKAKPNLVEVIKREDTGFGYTMTPVLLRHARKVLLLVAGDEKESVVRDLIMGKKGAPQFPVGLVNNLIPGVVTVLTDQGIGTLPEDQPQQSGQESSAL